MRVHVSRETQPNKKTLSASSPAQRDTNHQAQTPGSQRLSFDISRVSFTASGPQQKSMVSSPSDRYEREADIIADRVVKMADPRVGIGVAPTMIQRKSQSSLEPPVKGPMPDTRKAVETAKGSGTPLPDDLRSYFEPRFGYDFGKVRVHVDGDAALAARSVQARAYAIGDDVIFGAGHYRPSTVEGKRLIAHELVHVIQQAGGRSASDAPPSLQRREGRASDLAPIPTISSRENSEELQRDVDVGDVISFLRWTNPITFGGKLLQEVTGVEVNPVSATEQAIKVSASSISIPATHIAKLKEYAKAAPEDGAILTDALSQSPSYYQGGLLLKAVGEAEAITLGNSIFFDHAPPAVETFVHEMVRIHQYRQVGRVAFLATYYGMTLATILSRAVRGEKIDVMKSNPYENAAYALEGRFKAWHAKSPS